MPPINPALAAQVGPIEATTANRAVIERMKHSARGARQRGDEPR